MEQDNSSFDKAIRAHDAAIEARGLAIWVGAEPTFTNRWSESPEWLTDALGDTKQDNVCNIMFQMVKF